MIYAKNAYEFALRHLKELVGDYECDLEEIELSPDGKLWIVTLSYYEKKPQVDSLGSVKVLKKFAKKFRVSSENGSFSSMKNASLY